MLGDGICDAGCNVESCEFDKGDCKDPTTGEPKTQCSEFCQERYIGDTWCDDECYIEACNWDGGDCDEKYGPGEKVEDEKEEEVVECAFECKNSMIDNGTCDLACRFSSACNYDGNDCTEDCSPGCSYYSVGDDSCYSA